MAEHSDGPLLHLVQFDRSAPGGRGGPIALHPQAIAFIVSDLMETVAEIDNSQPAVHHKYRVPVAQVQMRPAGTFLVFDELTPTLVQRWEQRLQSIAKGQ